MIGRMYEERRFSLLTIAAVSGAILMLLLLPTLIAPFATAGQLPLTDMGPAVFVYTGPEVCGFLPHDIAANIGEPTDIGLPVLDGEPTVFVPDLKEGDYATNFFLHNSDQQKEVENLTWFFYLEYFGFTAPNGTFFGYPVKRAINMTSWLLEPDFSILMPRNGSIAIGCNQANAYETGDPLLAPLAGTDPVFLNKTDAIIDFLVAEGIVANRRSIANGSVLFWKGLNIWNQTKGDAVDTTAFPIDIDVVYSFESSVNKIWFMILKDPTRTIPRHLLFKHLEIVVAFRPLNKTQLGNNWFEVVQIDRLIRQAIADEFGPTTANRVILRVIDVDFGVGSSWQVVESLTFREVPP